MIPTIAARARVRCPSLLRDAVITNPKAFPPRRPAAGLGLLIGKYFRAGRSHRAPARLEARVADLLVVGSVALDSVETPFGKVQEALGGSATFFSYSASFFTAVRLVGDGRRGFPRGST